MITITYPNFVTYIYTFRWQNALTIKQYFKRQNETTTDIKMISIGVKGIRDETSSYPQNYYNYFVKMVKSYCEFYSSNSL